MRLLRKTWGSRLIAGWLTACLLVSVFATGTRGAMRPVGAPYAEWLRAQLRLPADAAVEAALDEAMSANGRTLEAFLAAFVAAYETQRPQASLAASFVTHDLSNDALIAYLESRFNGVGAEGVPVRAAFNPMLAPAGKSPDRADAGAFLVVLQATSLSATVFVRRAGVVRPFVRLLRILSAARPLGP